MRFVLYAIVLSGTLLAQSSFFMSGPLSAAQDAAGSSPATHHEGIFFVDGIDFHFAAATKSTVVIAARSVVNRKYLGVKVRIINTGNTSITVKPQDVLVEDALTGRGLQATTGTELAKKMSKPYNWARLGVKMGAGSTPDTEETGIDPQQNEMFRMMRQMATQMGSPLGRPTLSTADETAPGPTGSEAVFSDEVSYLRRREADGPNLLLQLQRQNSPEFIDQTTLLANTIPPRGDMQGVLFYPMGKLARDPAAVKGRSQSHLVRVIIPVAGESFSFLLGVD